jgi:peptidoglycan-associated lipoprotein
MNRSQRLASLLGVLLALTLVSSCAHKAAPKPAPVTQAPPVATTPVPAPTPPPPPPPAPAPVAAPTFTASDLQPVFFEFDSATLTELGRSTLDQNAKMLRDHADAKLVIEGHCDERGTSEYNQALGEKRAQAAREYLVGAGIAPTRLEIVSYGKERPFEAGHDESAWAKNRRAHFTIRT